MTVQPLVSVVVPTFNRSHLLGEAIASVQRQSYRDWELIVVDDGSTDQSVSILAALGEPRLTVVEHTHCGLPGLLRNVGIARARGKYVAFLDSDDTWQASKLERQIDVMEAQNAIWCYTYSSRLIHGATHGFRFVPSGRGAAIDLMSHRGSIVTPSVVARTDVLRLLNGFDASLDYCEDFDLWIRLAIEAEPVCVAEELTITRHVADHFPSPGLEVAQAWVQVYSKHLDNPRKEIARLARQRAALNMRAIAKMIASDRLDAMRVFRASLQHERLSPAVLRDAAALAKRILWAKSQPIGPNRDNPF